MYDYGKLIVKNDTAKAYVPYTKYSFNQKKDMEENKHKAPMQETTKDDSSDVEKVKQDKPTAPPQTETEQNISQSSKEKEEEEAEKGHS